MQQRTFVANLAAVGVASGDAAERGVPVFNVQQKVLRLSGPVRTPTSFCEISTCLNSLLRVGLRPSGLWGPDSASMDGLLIWRGVSANRCAKGVCTEDRGYCISAVRS